MSAAMPTSGPGRDRLPDRRGHQLLNFEHEAQRFVGGVGRFADGRLAELFVNAAKVGSAVEANAQEAALLASLALQFGCPIAGNGQLAQGRIFRCDEK